ncbi:GntR family transcriptional regulator [Cryobacterium zongtaii]|uniref:GntR family transcriptional regulator n=2 Tax=Cryobacterium zongtaii TaxID=1259217 RepID=A0A2S3Z5Z2_9MICO|nr:GntR family transcriptional regulator [Cryobacterium zongtaii]POH62307.1 GntR family transcriptional regulator [Cryobacterium zongtaii]
MHYVLLHTIIGMTIYSELHRLVVSGQLDPKVRIAEADLATRLGVSRTPIREALHRLEGDGLVIAQGRGVRVKVMAIPELADLLSARAGLEGWAVFQAAQRVSAGELPPAALAELAQLADSAASHTRAGDLEQGVDFNRLFHERSAALASNAAISATLALWWDRITVSTKHTLHTPERVEQVDREHRVIIDAVLGGDAAAARDAVEKHILNTRETLLALNEGPQQ